MSTAKPHGSQLDVESLPYIAGQVKYGQLIEGVERYRYDTVDRSRTNLVLETRDVKVFDVRSLRDRLSYSRDGFSLLNHTSQFARLANSDRAAEETFLLELRENYLREMGDFVRAVSGTPHVFPQPIGFFVRHGSRSKVKTSQRPAALPHVDFTAGTANEMAAMIQRDSAPGLKYRHFAIYQTWRAVSPAPQDNVLCFCDVDTVVPEDFKVVESIMGPEDQPGNVYRMEMALHSPAHRWMYFADMQPDEVLLFQGYDTRSPRPILHTSVNNPTPGASVRVSIECRHYAFFE